VLAKKGIITTPKIKESFISGVSGNQKAIAANQATIKHTGVNALQVMKLPMMMTTSLAI
jgi:hypothetical protein